MPTSTTARTWTFPTLYKRTSTGAIQFWEIAVDSLPRNLSIELPGEEYGVIRTTFGQVDTGSPQSTRDIVKAGKNIGRANETSAVEQAVAEAEAKWVGKKKKGYVENAYLAQSGTVDSAVIAGGIEPMTAHKFAEQGHKIQYPCAIQPKLDGIRCVAVVEGGRCSLWTRSRKPILSAPHVIAALEDRFPGTDIVLDGELYSHELSDNFNKIVSLVRDSDTSKDKDYESIQYHIYDMVSSDPFRERAAHLETIFSGDVTPMVLVETRTVKDKEEVKTVFREYVAGKYEGAMLRNLDSPYEHKRTANLQKFKEAFDDEFEIIGIEEGRGRLAGHVGTFVCKTKAGVLVYPKPAGKMSFLKECFENHALWKGKQLVVQYKGYTPDGSLREPIGIRFRDSVDF